MQQPLEALQEPPEELVLPEKKLKEPMQSKPFNWDNYKDSPMLELWTARTRNLREPQVPD